MNKSSFPIVTLLITLVCLVLHLFFVQSMTEGLESNSFLNHLILARTQIWDGQYWGLLTGSFVHAESMQLVLYLMAFWYFGSLVELSVGRQALLACVYFGAIIPNAAQLALSESPNVLAMGMCGVVYTLFGLLLTMRPSVPAYRRMIGNVMIRWMVFWLLICMLLASFARVAPMTASVYYISQIVLIVYMLAAFIALLRAGVGANSMRRILVLLVPSDPRLRFVVLLIFNLALLTNALYWPMGQIAQLVGVVMGMAAGYVFILHRHRLQYALVLALFVLLTLCSVRWMPWSDSWMLYRIYELTDSRQDALALEKLESLFARKPGSPIILNGLAWLLATSDDPQFGDGEKAIELAIRANALAHWEEPGLIDTLAAAYAQAGQWDKALGMQQLALNRMDSAPFVDSRYHELRAELEKNYKKIEQKEKIRR